MSKNKTFLYHMVPLNMKGDVLHPLNVLKDKNPELYFSIIKKYEGREHVMQQFIPTLECLWNDVLHFSAVDPVVLKKALLESGVESKPMKFYKIDPKLLDPQKTTVYLYPKNDITPDDFVSFNENELIKYSEISEKTKEYYRKKVNQGVQPLLFAWVPHIFYKGSLDVSNLPIIEI